MGPTHVLDDPWAVAWLHSTGSIAEAAGGVAFVYCACAQQVAASSPFWATSKESEMPFNAHAMRQHYVADGVPTDKVADLIIAGEEDAVRFEDWLCRLARGDASTLSVCIEARSTAMHGHRFGYSSSSDGDSLLSYVNIDTVPCQRSRLEEEKASAARSVEAPGSAAVYPHGCHLILCSAFPFDIHSLDKNPFVPFAHVPQPLTGVPPFQSSSAAPEDVGTALSVTRIEKKRTADQKCDMEQSGESSPRDDEASVSVPDCDPGRPSLPTITVKADEDEQSEAAESDTACGLSSVVVEEPPVNLADAEKGGYVSGTPSPACESRGDPAEREFPEKGQFFLIPKNEVESLVKAKTFLASIEAVAECGGFDFDVASGCTMWSSGMFRLLGADSSAGSPKSIEDVLVWFHPEDSARLLLVHERAVNEGVPFCIDLRTAQATHKPDSDSARSHASIVEVRGEVVRGDGGKGAVIRVCGTLQDVTKARLAEDTLRENKRSSLKAQEMAKMGRWEWSADDGEWTVWATELYRMHGIPVAVDGARDSVMGLSLPVAMDPNEPAVAIKPPSLKEYCDQYVHEGDRYAFETLVQAALQNGEDSFDLEYRILRGGNPDSVAFISIRGEKVVSENCMHADRTALSADLSMSTSLESASEESSSSSHDVSVVSLQPHVIVRGFMQDVSDRATAEKMLAESQFKSDFVTKVSHELRTPLTGIVGLTEILHRSGLSTEQQHYVSLIRQSSDGLLSLVTDVLDLAKMEYRKVRLAESAFDLLHLIEDTAELLSAQVEERRIDFAVEYSPTDWCWFAGDQARMRQIITNLLGNAIRFSEGKSIVLSCAVSVYDAKSLFLPPASASPGMGHKRTETSLVIMPDGRHVLFPRHGNRSRTGSSSSDGGGRRHSFSDSVPPRLENLAMNAHGQQHQQHQQHLHLQQHDGQKAIVTLTVADSGRGIAEETLPHIFEKFEQGILDADMKDGGSGLGLPIVKQLVNLMGGQICVSSTHGAGATFTLRIPLTMATPTTQSAHMMFRTKPKATAACGLSPVISIASSDVSVVDSIAASESTITATAKPPFSGKKAFVAMPDECSRASVVRTLQDTGFHVDPVSNESAVVEALRGKDGKPSDYDMSVVCYSLLKRLGPSVALRTQEQWRLEQQSSDHVNFPASTHAVTEESGTVADGKCLFIPSPLLLVSKPSTHHEARGWLASRSPHPFRVMLYPPRQSALLEFLRSAILGRKGNNPADPHSVHNPSSRDEASSDVDHGAAALARVPHLASLRRTSSVSPTLRSIPSTDSISERNADAVERWEEERTPESLPSHAFLPSVIRSDSEGRPTLDWSPHPTASPAVVSSPGNVPGVASSWNAYGIESGGGAAGAAGDVGGVHEGSRVSRGEGSHKIESFVPPTKFVPQGDTGCIPFNNRMRRDVRVLVVDDNRINRLVAVRFLSFLGFASDVACDGSEALIRRRSCDYDVIFMDINMPNMGGFDCARVIRALESERAREEFEDAVMSILREEEDAYLQNMDVLDELKERFESSENAQGPSTNAHCVTAVHMAESTRAPPTNSMASPVGGNTDGHDDAVSVSSDVSAVCEISVADAHILREKVERRIASEGLSIELFLRHTPIIALSSHTGDSLAADCAAAGMSGVLSRPLSADAILDVIQRVVVS